MDESIEGAVVDRSRRPPGVVSRNAGTYVAIVLVGIVATAVILGGRSEASRAGEAAAPEGALRTTPNDATTTLASQQRLEEEAARRREREREMLGLAPRTSAPANPEPPPSAYYGGEQPRKSLVQEEAERQAADLRRREYASRFASSAVPLGGFGQPSAPRAPWEAFGATGAPAAAPPPPEMPAELAGLDPAVLQELMAAIESNPDGLDATTMARLFAATTSAPGPSSASRLAPAPRPAALPMGPYLGPTHVLFEGTTIETVLLTRLVSELSGPVICQVSTDVYSRDRRHVLIPAGSRVIGEARHVTAQGQTRLAVVFHRLIRTDGFSVSLEQFAGLSQSGETGLKDKVNNHYLRIFGTSIALGALGGLQALGATYGPWGGGATPGDSGRIGAAGRTADTAESLLERYTNIPPTLTIREGTRVKVFLTQDLQLPAVEPRSASRRF